MAIAKQFQNSPEAEKQEPLALTVGWSTRPACIFEDLDLKVKQHSAHDIHS